MTWIVLVFLWYITFTLKTVILQYKSFTAATIEGALSVDTVVFTPSIGYSTLVDIYNNEILAWL